jgi:MFS family permease
VIAVSNIVVQIVLLQIMIVLRDSGRATWIIGVVLATSGLMGVPAAWAAPRILVKFPPRLVYRTALWSWTALLVPLVFTADPIVLIVCWAGVGAVGIVDNVALSMYRMDRVPDELLGRASAGVGLVCAIGSATGAPIAGYLVRGLGISGVPVVACALMAALALCGTVVDSLRR